MTGIEWFEAKGKTPNSLQHVQLEEIDRADAYCRRCQAGEDIPCLGMRPVFAEEESNYYESFRVSGQECPKAMEAAEERAMFIRMQRSGIPNPAEVAGILSAKTVFHTKGINLAKLRFGKKTFDSSLLYHQDDEETAPLFTMLTVLCIKEGYSARYVDPYSTFATWDKRWHELTEELVAADIVFARRIDREVGADFKRKALMQAIYGRMSQGKITVVSLTPKPKPLTDDEKELFSEILKWQQFNLS